MKKFIALFVFVLMVACAGPMQSSLTPMTGNGMMGQQNGMYGMGQNGMGQYGMMPGMGSAGMMPVGVPGGMTPTVASTMPAIAGLPGYAGTSSDAYLHPYIAQSWLARRQAFGAQAAAAAQNAPRMAQQSGGDDSDDALDAVMDQTAQNTAWIRAHSGAASSSQLPASGSQPPATTAPTAPSTPTPAPAPAPVAASH